MRNIMFVIAHLENNLCTKSYMKRTILLLEDNNKLKHINLFYCGGSTCPGLLSAEREP